MCFVLLQVNALATMNNGWEETLATSRANLNAFGERLGIMEGDVDKLDELATVMQSLVNAKRAMQNEERILFELEKQYQRVTSASQDELEIMTCKRAVCRCVFLSLVCLLCLLCLLCG